jgi:twitching motility two-component system response regulator PilG
MQALVIVIDDSLTVRKIMGASLQRAGFQTASFGDGFQAMAALTRGDLPIPDAILIDVELPRLDGYALVRRFRQHAAFANVVIMMLSGHTGWTNKVRAWRVGATAYLTKPFDPKQVIAALHRHLAE